MAENDTDHPPRRATLIHDTGEREDDALERLQWVVPTVFLGASMILFFAVVEWFSPHVPILLFAGLVWAPVGLFLAWKTQVSNPRSLAMALAMLATLGLPLLAWNAGHYRAAALWVMAETTPFDISMDTVDDRSDRVVSMACERVLTSDEMRSVQRLRTVLVQRPEVAVTCLRNIEDERNTAAVHLARHLQTTWYGGWMTEPDFDADLACRAAEQFVNVSKITQNPGVAELLMCSLDSEHEAFSECCGKALSANTDEARILEVRPQRWMLATDERLFVALLEAVDVPAHTLMGTEPVDQTLAWTPADLFHWTTHLGCHLMDHYHRPEEIARQLSRTIDTQCGLDVGDPLFSFAAVRFVERTCDGVTTTERRRVDVVEWCDVARRANRDTAVDAAQILVHRASRAYEIGELFDQVAAGGQLADLEALRESLFSTDDESLRRFDQAVGTDGIRLHRPSWRDQTPDERATLESMRSADVERARKARRELADQGPLHELSDDEMEREIDRSVTEQIRSEIEAARQMGAGRD